MSDNPGYSASESTDTFSSSHASSSSDVASTMIAFDGWNYKHYFVLLNEDAKNIRVRCTLCAGNKTLSSAKNTTSNLKKHLKSVHKNSELVAKEVERPDRKRRRESDADLNDGGSKKQCTLPTVLNKRSISADKMRSLLAEYVIEDMRPLSTVESPAFRKLINSICPTQLPDRKSFTAHLDTIYDSMVDKI